MSAPVNLSAGAGSPHLFVCARHYVTLPAVVQTPQLRRCGCWRRAVANGRCYDSMCFPQKNKKTCLRRAYRAQKMCGAACGQVDEVLSLITLVTKKQCTSF